MALLFAAVPNAMTIATRLACLPLSCLLFACVPTAGSDGDGARPTPSAQAAATRSAAPEPDPSAPPLADETEPMSHCEAHEHTVFSCRLTGSERVVSLCLSIRGDQAHYVAGSASDRELTHAGPFQRTSLAYAGGTGGYAYSFEHSGQTRVLYSVSGEEQLARSGELVIENGTVPVTDAVCEPGSLTETDDIAVLRHVRSWPPHARLERHGLPQLKP